MACNPSTHTCGTSCDGVSIPCNGGCCSSGTCVNGSASATACGYNGGVCATCVNAGAGSAACASTPGGGSCFCNGNFAYCIPSGPQSIGTQCVQTYAGRPNYLCGCNTVADCISPATQCVNNECLQ
jgi:hypothetical protein